MVLVARADRRTALAEGHDQGGHMASLMPVRINHALVGHAVK